MPASQQRVQTAETGCLRLYRWKAKYGGMEASEAKRLRSLEEENRQLHPHSRYGYRSMGRTKTGESHIMRGLKVGGRSPHEWFNGGICITGARNISPAHCAFATGHFSILAAIPALSD